MSNTWISKKRRIIICRGSRNRAHTHSTDTLKALHTHSNTPFPVRVNHSDLHLSRYKYLTDARGRRRGMRPRRLVYRPTAGVDLGAFASISGGVCLHSISSDIVIISTSIDVRSHNLDTVLICTPRPDWFMVTPKAERF